jgi:5S rRNA maturation endonuclease (ribonuclease M5)
MSKLPLNSVKYSIEGKIVTSKEISESDIIGSLYAQTEGILDDELDLNNLYKFGKIGRISVKIVKKGKTVISYFTIPTNLSKMDVSLIAATCESVDKVGNTSAKVTILNIEDNQSQRRQQVFSRAEELFKNLKGSLDSTSDIKEKIQDKLFLKNIIEYTKGRVFGGEGVLDNDKIILVEGRADVVTLVKSNRTNVLSFNGSKIDKSAIRLAKDKEVTLFLDGDNSGEEFSKTLQKQLRVSYIAFAPKGREVESLSLPELEKCLKNKKEVTEVKKIVDVKQQDVIVKKCNVIKKVPEETQGVEAKLPERKNYFTKKEFIKTQELVENLKNSSKFIVVGKYLKEIQEGEVSDILTAELEEGKILLFDGMYESSMNKKLQNSNYEVILCRRTSKLKIINNHVLTFDEFNALSE